MSPALTPADSVIRAADGAPEGAARRIDAQPAAWLVSLIVHFGAMMLLATITLALPRRADLSELSVDTAENIDVDPTPQEFASSDRQLADIGALSAGGGETSALAMAPELSPESLLAHESEVMSELAERPAVAVDLDLDLFPARGPELSSELPVQGAGSVGVTGAEGAIDRLTHEILASLEQRPTLVVWLFDESGSLRDERRAIIKRFRRIYEELGVIESANNPAFARHRDKPLLTTVVGFGAEPRTLTAEPTDKLDEIIGAVEQIDRDARRLRRKADGSYDPDQYK